MSRRIAKFFLVVVASLLVTQINDGHALPSDGIVHMSGQFELRLDETAVQLMGKTICFIPEAESKKLVPRDNDDRMPWFCFSNQDEAMKMLGVPKEDRGSCGFTGSAEILITNYVVDKTEGDVFDQAKLVTVISHSPVAPMPCD